MKDSDKNVCRKGSERADGVELLRYRIDVPCLEDETLDEVYRQVADRVEDFCKGELTRRAHLAWEESDDPQKRFRFPTFLYALSVEITERDAQRCAIRTRATLRRKGNREPLRLYDEVQTWHLLSE